jgi:hypothetical protein
MCRMIRVVCLMELQRFFMQTQRIVYTFISSFSRVTCTRNVYVSYCATGRSISNKVNESTRIMNRSICREDLTLFETKNYIIREIALARHARAVGAENTLEFSFGQIIGETWPRDLYSPFRGKTSVCTRLGSEKILNETSGHKLSSDVRDRTGSEGGDGPGGKG